MRPMNLLLIALTSLVCFPTWSTAEEPVRIGSQRELFVDNSLAEAITGGATIRLHAPVQREVAITYDKPWEGNASGYTTVFQDGDIYRMY